MRTLLTHSEIKITTFLFLKLGIRLKLNETQQTL